MIQSLKLLEHRIESVEPMVHQLLKTIGAPPENHTVVGLESAGPSKDGYYRNDESNVEDCGLGPTCKDGDSRNDESNVEDCGLESAGPNKDGDSRNDESKEDETIDEILTDKVEEEDGRPIDMNHTGDSFDASALNEKNDSDGVKADVQGPRPDTAHIRQDEPVEVIQKDKGGDIDVETEKEDMLKNKVSSEEEDVDTETSHIRRDDPVEELIKDKDLSVEENADAHNLRDDPVEDKGLSEQENVDVEIEMEEMLKDTGLSEEEGTDTGVVMDSIPEKVT
ncbi:uncharacterized protein LOC113293385 [Papaver somniferum]|uniref:uncharacterized protein LOC113293385 n=1 Tax=Papaver somniferum TaxID=3469 RepID=UPI000E6FD843|nr:uncharacterized protein LOC113293385 [Papaver somniferum]